MEAPESCTLLELLSSLTVLEHLKNDPSTVSWLWSQLSSTPPTDDDPTQSQLTWYKFLQPVPSLLKELTPLEIHATAKDALVFSLDPDDVASTPTSYTLLCLLLCVYALRECPSSGSANVRWKRWQSVMFETVALFQRCMLRGNDLTDDEQEETRTKRVSPVAVELWMEHLLPACRQVQRALPPADTSLTPIVAGLVGTTSRLVWDHVVESNSADTLVFAKAIGPVVGDHYEKWIWCHPWRTAAVRKGYKEEDALSHFEYLKHKSELSWWTGLQHGHEAVAYMETSWDELGISFMAASGFEFRPLVFSSNFIWNLWFPHVSTLLLHLQKQPVFTKVPLSLLRAILDIVGERTRKWVVEEKTLPSSPIGTFQLLLNGIVAAKDNPTMDATMYVDHIKLLLSKYLPCSQVKIVQTLVEDCPHPGMVPKLLDFLRPLVTLDEPEPALWDYLATYWKTMADHVEESETTILLCNTDALLDRVETFVSAITMLQLSIMVKSVLPPNSHAVKSTLPALHQALQDQLQIWSTSSTVVPPTDHYRLYLLETALQQVISLLKDV